MTLEDRFGLLFMGYFALVVSLGVGVFARGITLVAVLIVIALSLPLLALLMLVINALAADERDLV